jgi:hypothetical protein
MTFFFLFFSLSYLPPLILPCRELKNVFIAPGKVIMLLSMGKKEHLAHQGRKECPEKKNITTLRPKATIRPKAMP